MKTCENCGNHEKPECESDCTPENQKGWKRKEICTDCQRLNCNGTLCLHREWFIPKDDEVSKDEFISLDRLNGLYPTIESCTYKLIEELGELLQSIGKGNQMSGEKPRLKTGEKNPLRLIEEAFDVAQSAVTMIYAIADKFGISVDEQQKLHEEKLIKKGYLVEK